MYLLSVNPVGRKEKNMENKCPICPRHCDLSNPHCPRGQEYAKTGIMAHKRLEFDSHDQAMVMKYIHHAVREIDHGQLTQDDAHILFNFLSDHEVKQLGDLLKKISDYWHQLNNQKS